MTKTNQAGGFWAEHPQDVAGVSCCVVAGARAGKDVFFE
jgi:hypothetical protein